MKTSPQRKFSRFLAVFLVTLQVFMSSLYCGTALAQSSPEIPSPSTDFYYNDQANLLSDATKALILTKNAELSTASIQLVVLTTDALPVTGYTQRVEYLRSVIRSWKVGGEGGRGLLLALSVSDGDYLAVAGDGLQSFFTTDLLKSLLDAQLEPDFSTGAYDAGVSKFVAEAAAQAQSFAASPTDQPAAAPVESSPGQAPGIVPEKKKDGGAPILLWLAIGAAAVAVVCIGVFLLAGGAGRRRYAPRRGVHRHAPLVTPPRTNVLRHENHTPMVIKSAHRGDRIRKL